ncbi:hypothetical protein LTR09_008855 [Extremus antarcticus]|uniref:Uncharacterized protein n=1 Tax=Extremus antarcticus TaxID=702011 RepID=A0AAJ0DGT5_9PEZI|nr:hypothetical protein LTR09_008855 [Extremus antarcticus]
MPPLESLNAVGQCFELQSTDAWKLFENEEFEAANTLVPHQLLIEPAISDLQAAKLYLILVHSPDEYLGHAKKAVELYKGLYPDEEKPPNRAQLNSKRTMVAGAERALRKARAGADLYPACLLTDEEILAKLGKATENLEKQEIARFAKFEDAGAMDAGADGDGDLPDIAIKRVEDEARRKEIEIFGVENEQGNLDILPNPSAGRLIRTHHAF